MNAVRGLISLTEAYIQAEYTVSMNAGFYLKAITALFFFFGVTHVHVCKVDPMNTLLCLDYLWLFASIQSYFACC